MAHPATKHLSIIDVTVTDDFIERRTKAASAIATRWRRISTAGAALEKANAIARALIDASNGGPVPSALRLEVGGDIAKFAPTHDVEDGSKDFEVAVVASVAAIMVFETNSNRTDHCTVLAEALSAAMDISATKGAPRVVDLWNDLAQAARMLGDGAAERERARVEVKEDEPEVAVRALAANARRDQEELNVLWWALSDWSAVSNSRLSGLPTSDAVVLAAVELATLLGWPAVRSLRQLAHRNLADDASELSLAQLVSIQQDLREKTLAILQPMQSLIASHPRIFVALATIATNDVDATAAENGIDVDQVAPAWKWTERLVRELSLARSAGGRLGPIE